MINCYEIKSNNSKIYFQLVTDYWPELLTYGQVVSKDSENPYIEEPGTIIFKITPKKDHIISRIYIEPRKNDVLVEFGNVTHMHYSWDKEEDKYKIVRMRRSIEYVKRFVSGELALICRRQFLFGQYYDIVETNRLKELSGLRKVILWE